MNKDEIAQALNESHEAFLEFAGGLSDEDFNASRNEKWSTAEQVDHIRRGIAPLAQAFALPKFVPRMLFGKAASASRDYDTIVATYRQKLAEGGRASGRFIPDSDHERTALAAAVRSKLSSLIKGFSKLSEEELDAIRLPHPILGKLTVREMLYFTIYHVRHHHRAARVNLGLENAENKI